MNGQQHDIAIIGGGMVGMSLAIALAAEGISVLLLERGALSGQLDATFDGRVSAIAQGSKRILDAIGVWDGIKNHAQPIADIRVSDGDTPFFLHYDHEEIGDDPFGYIAENRHIRHAMHQAAHTLPSLTIKDHFQLAGYTADSAGVTITGKDGAEYRCQLVVGADGKNSQIRQLAGIDSTEWGYQQTAIVCTIAHSEPHHGLAQERFLPAGPFAVLPMTENRSSLVWVEPADRAPIYLRLPPEEFVQEIKERAGNHLGDITVAGQRFSYPLSLMHARSYVAERTLLIGDAAHAIHPIAGQGVNLGFRDVAVLHELLVKAKEQGADMGRPDILEHYQRWRRMDNLAMLAVTDGLNRLFTTGISPVKLARGLGLWTVAKVPPVKRFFMRHAMGLTGDLPILARKN